ncbi:hypothetical protein SAMN04488570_0253 [Nocardioides scoriae]|uniref:Lipoprotein n=1 Tax=Nocardioides scoriae TaxID=642780 RepID=A0A1H1LKS3_9ACTN|nr:hypothetical protein [Nocardioides scoriae]SDR74922.1 hypothetical protein SAMN04488570_0253 [Nocardioides scoriae]
MSTMLTTKGRKGLAAIALVAMTGTMAACGSSDDSSASASSSSSSSASTQAAPKPVAAIDSLTGKNTQVALDAGFVDALKSLKLTPGTTGKAKLVGGGGTLQFPISGGNVTVFKPGTVSPYVIGQVQHEGSGLSLTAGDTKVEINNLNVDPGVSRVYGDVLVNGEVAASSAYVFTLDGRTLNPLKTGDGTATLQGTKVEISPVAAGLLNQTFKTDAVKPGLLVGIAKITVNTTPGD